MDALCVCVCTHENVCIQSKLEVCKTTFKTSKNSFLPMLNANKLNKNKDLILSPKSVFQAEKDKNVYLIFNLKTEVLAFWGFLFLAHYNGANKMKTVSLTF